MPAEPVPSVERDPAQPPRLLPDRRIEAVGEVRANRDRGPAGPRGNAHENAAPARLRDAQAQLIVLGDAGPVERASIVLIGDTAECGTREGAADSRGGNGGTGRLAHDELLGVLFGKFVGIGRRHRA